MKALLKVIKNAARWFTGWVKKAYGSSANWIKINARNFMIWTKKRYWGFVDWITRQVFWLAVLPWTLPILGGLMISTHLGDAFHFNFFWGGVGLILFSTIPLGFNALGLRRKELFDDQIDAQEQQCAALAVELIPLIPTDPLVPYEDRQEALESAIVRICESLTKDVYSNVPGVRVTVFRYGHHPDSGEEGFYPAFSDGRGDEPGTHMAGSDRFKALYSLATGKLETHSESDIEGQSYESFIAASIYRGEVIFGVISIDASTKWEFTRRDATNILVLARLLSAFFSGAAHQGVYGKGELPRDTASQQVVRGGLFTRLMGHCRLFARGGTSNGY